ncbi:pyrimidine/purine nucleoside phosphorylase [Pelosinus sp. sgz500959]|uniref:pyrimidine/purine nucleoside phosphorylase n=1 Tax=Pelosinus sp. sgz500959 TaxID=3242472 RepID=UPI00366A9766
MSRKTSNFTLKACYYWVGDQSCCSTTHRHSGKSRYDFGTDAAEVMEILAGEMEVLLPGQTEWQTYSAGDSFNVPANSRFKLQVKAVADYCCSYEVL